MHYQRLLVLVGVLGMTIFGFMHSSHGELIWDPILGALRQKDMTTSSSVSTTGIQTVIGDLNVGSNLYVSGTISGTISGIATNSLLLGGRTEAQISNSVYTASVAASTNAAALLDVPISSRVTSMEGRTNTWDAAYPSSNPSNFYPASNPSNWVTQTITNGLPYVPVAGGVMTGILNHGGYGITNFNGLYGYGNVWHTNSMFAIGSTDSTKAKLYVSGEGGVATNLPLVWLNRSSLATGPILQWGVNGATNGSIDVNGNLTMGTGKINSIWTNAGTFQMSAITTQLVSLAMNGSAWSFRKPMIWSTNISFSATAKVSLFNNLPLAGCTEMWRNKSVAIASVTNSTPLLLATNIIPVVDGTPFSTLTDPFQIVIVDGASTECMTITNVTGNSLYSAYPSRFAHGGNVVVSHGCSLNVPGWVNDESGGSTLRLYVEFPTAQTVGIGYSLPYVRVQ